MRIDFYQLQALVKQLGWPEAIESFRASLLSVVGLEEVLQILNILENAGKIDQEKSYEIHYFQLKLKVLSEMKLKIFNLLEYIKHLEEYSQEERNLALELAQELAQQQYDAENILEKEKEEIENKKLYKAITLIAKQLGQALLQQTPQQTLHLYDEIINMIDQLIDQQQSIIDEYDSLIESLDTLQYELHDIKTSALNLKVELVELDNILGDLEKNNKNIYLKNQLNFLQETNKQLYENIEDDLNFMQNLSHRITQGRSNILSKMQLIKNAKNKMIIKKDNYHRKHRKLLQKEKETLEKHEKFSLESEQKIKNSSKYYTKIMLIDDSNIEEKVIPPFLIATKSRGHAANFNFCLGVMPPRAIFGR